MSLVLSDLGQYDFGPYGMDEEGGDAGGGGGDDFTAEGAFVLTPIDESGQADYSSYAESAGGNVYSDYAQPGAGAPQYYPPGYQQPYGMQPQYGMPSPYGYPQAPYGYPQQPYGQQPYGYDPYGQQGYGYQDPYQQQLAYQQCAMQFPAGTPQSVIDASCAMQQGAVQPWQVQQGVTDLMNQGQTDAAAALLQKFTGQPGFHRGEPTAAELARGCKRITYAGQTVGTFCSPAATQTPEQKAQREERKKQLLARPGSHIGQPTEAEKKAGCKAVSLGKGASGEQEFITICAGYITPTDPAQCKTEMQKLLASSEYKAAQVAMKAKRPLTDEQRGLVGRYVILARCAGVTGTELQVAASKGKWTQRSVATRARSMLLSAWVKRCKEKKCGDDKYAVKNWTKALENARTLPETKIADACALKVIQAAQDVGKNIIASGQAGSAQWDAYVKACQACKVPAMAPGY